MADSKSSTKGTAALVGVLAAIASALGTIASQKVIGTAQAQVPSGLATAAQVEALERKVDRVAEEVTVIKLEQARQQGARDANFRERGR